MKMQTAGIIADLMDSALSRHGRFLFNGNLTLDKKITELRSATGEKCCSIPQQSVKIFVDNNDEMNIDGTLN